MAENTPDTSENSDNQNTPEKEKIPIPAPQPTPPRTVTSAFAKAAANQNQGQAKPQPPAQPQQSTPAQQAPVQPSAQSQPGPQTQPQVTTPAQSSSPTLQEAITAPIDRRTFIKWSAVGWTAFAAVLGGYATMVMRFMFPNVLFEPVQTFRAGFPDEYPIGDVSERWKEKYGVWVVRDDEKIYALSTVCTHLGCTPNWLANDNKFKCPCHGSGFFKTGINFEGPAPRPLERFKIYLADDGEVVVDKTKKYQQEKGEWKDPESFIAT